MTDSHDFTPILAQQSSEPADWDSGQIFSLCIGLGRETEPLLAALCQHERRNFAVDGLFVQSGTNPSVLEAWSSGTPIKPPDCLVLAIDAADPQALELSRFWAARLGQKSVGQLDGWRTAIIGGDAPSEITASLEHELSAHFDAVIHILPQRSVLQRLAMLHLTMGLLFLNRSLICHDGEDLHGALSAGSHVRAAATVWNHPGREQQAFDHLWRELQPQHPKGVMAFLSGAISEISIGEFTRLSDNLRDRLPEEAMVVAPTYAQHNMRAGRRIMAIALADDSVSSGGADQ